MFFWNSLAFSMIQWMFGHNWATSLSLFTFIHWRRKWQLTAVFLPGESQGRGEPGGLPSMGSHRVRHDWSDLAAAAADVGNLISHSSAFSKNSLNILKFTVHVLLKPDLETFEHYFTSMWDECNCGVVSILWHCLSLVWNENWPFPVLWPLLSFPNLLAYWVQHFHSIIFQDLK